MYRSIVFSNAVELTRLGDMRTGIQIPITLYNVLTPARI